MLKNIENLLARQPTLTPEQHDEYRAITNRICRTAAELRRATKKGYAPESKTMIKANAAVQRAATMRDEFVSRIGIPAMFPAPPARIRYRSEGHWSNNGTRGVHVIVVEMVLDHLDVNGPYYRRVATISDVGGPPVNPRKPPDGMGCAWFAVNRLESIRDTE